MVTDHKIALKLVSLYESAAGRNIECTLSLKKVKELLNQKTCYYTGNSFINGNNRSIDRVDASKGYHDNNVVACGSQYNGKKGSLTIEEIKNLYNKVVQFEKRQNKKNNEKVTPKVVRKKAATKSIRKAANKEDSVS